MESTHGWSSWRVCGRTIKTWSSLQVAQAEKCMSVTLHILDKIELNCKFQTLQTASLGQLENSEPVFYCWGGCVTNMLCHKYVVDISFGLDRGRGVVFSWFAVLGVSLVLAAIAFFIYVRVLFLIYTFAFQFPHFKISWLTLRVLGFVHRWVQQSWIYKFLYKCISFFSPKFMSITMSYCGFDFSLWKRLRRDVNAGDGDVASSMWAIRPWLQHQVQLK